MPLKLSVRFSAGLSKQLHSRAEERGVTPSEYLRAVIENDLRNRGTADALAPLNTEITLVIGMMLREFLTQSLGPEAAKKLEDWASGRATGIVRQELRERAVDQ